jgi:hypothetical protein
MSRNIITSFNLPQSESSVRFKSQMGKQALLQEVFALSFCLSIKLYGVWIAQLVKRRATGWDLSRGKRFFCSLHPYQLWVLPSLLKRPGREAEH